MSELYFRLGETKGFTSKDLADKREGYATPIRELLQNSLDASRDAHNPKCEVNIEIKTIPIADIPHLQDYEEVLEKAIDTHKNLKRYNENAKRVVASIEETLGNPDIKMLIFTDNGAGMSPDRVGAMLGEASVKGDETSAGGSFGLGHLSSYSLSSLRYVLYAAKYKDETDNDKIKSLFTGSPILAGHTDQDADRGNRGRIVEDVPENERAPKWSYPKEFPDFVRSRMDRLDATGTAVIILGLSEEWDEEAEYAIASNFFHAISHDALSVTIHQEEREPMFIGTEEIGKLIERKKDGKRSTGGNILSGKQVYQVWQAVRGNNTQKDIKLSNGDKIYVCIETDKGGDSTIVLIRNGMLIARHDGMLSRAIGNLRKDSSFECFTAVIDVDKQDAPKLFDLVKGAEGPYHDKLERKRLKPAEERKLNELLKELSEKIKEYLTSIERESFDLPLFAIPGKAEAQSYPGGSSNGQGNRAKQSPLPRGQRRKESGRGINKNGPKPIINSRNLKSRNAVKYKDKGDKWEVELRIIPQNQESPKDDVYLSMCLGEDHDGGSVTQYLDFISVKIDERDAEKIHKKSVKLGQLKKDQPYHIVAEVAKSNKDPDEKFYNVGNMKVALLPILGLKQRSGSNG